LPKELQNKVKVYDSKTKETDLAWKDAKDAKGNPLPLNTTQAFWASYKNKPQEDENGDQVLKKEYTGLGSEYETP
jgi:hypothetical protein